MVIFFIASGVDVNERDHVTGYTPMHCAIERGHLAVVQLLVMVGADLRVMWRDRNLVDFARWVRKPECVEYLSSIARR